MSETADAVVLGLGPGGEEVAGRLAEAGLDVVGVEGNLVGGECPYWGCIPSKMMLRGSGALAEGRRIPRLAGRSSVTPDWSPVAARIREATGDWDDRAAVERLEGRGGRLVRGWGRLLGPHEVEVAGERIRARRAVVVATGSRPWVPPVPGLRELAPWTNRQAIEADSLPRSLLVLGGGAIGVELAQVFARFGAEVTVVEAAPHLLPAEEPEAGALLAEVLGEDSVQVVTGAAVTRAERRGDGRRLVLGDGTTFEGEEVLVATGRRVDLASIGVAALGLDEEARALPVDGTLRVVPGVWAVGDVTGKGAFTHMAVHQARIAVADILRQGPVPGEDRAVPRVTFTDPEVGSVGLSESAARDRGLAVRTGVADLPSSSRGWIHQVGNRGLIKLVEDAERRVLVGATSMGPMGGEVLSMLTLAVHASVPTDELGRMIYAFPTFHRAVEEALADLGN